ncbi:type III-B CRISPR module-associated protein Cmr5 [Nocardiopsis alba]|uniref:type III-B CRISPR module-associated protein Cmr5 n=1 Tax=Nocardiopsis alba TaxID=53437 RepID=UPI0033A721E7
MRRVDQNMARSAAGLLPQVEGEHAKELRTRFRHLPVQLHSSGLASTYVFLASRAASASSPHLRRAYTEVAQRIRTHLAEGHLIDAELGTAPVPGVHRAMLEALAGMDSVSYARATREIAVLFSWLRRLADAVYLPDRGTS